MTNRRSSPGRWRVGSSPIRFKRAHAACLVMAFWVAGSGWGFSAPERLVLRDGTGKVELPPLARAVYRDDSGRSWGVWGNMSGTLETAGADFEMFLSGQGWRWHTLMSVDNTQTRMRLIGLRKDSRKLLLMLWDAGPGRTGFAIGEDQGKEDDARKKTGAVI